MPLLNLRLFRYLGVGGACAALHNLIMIAGDAGGIPYPLSICVSYVLVVLLGYALHTTVTFREPRTVRGLLRYAAAIAGSIPATLLLLLVFKTWLRWPMAFASPAATVTMLAANYLTSRWAILPPRLRSAGHP